MAVSVEWRATVLKKAHCYYRERMSSSAYRVSIQRACSSWRLPLLSYISRGARGLCEDASLSTVSCPRIEGVWSGTQGFHRDAGL